MCGGTSANAQSDKIPQVFAKHLRPGVNYLTYLQQVMQPLNQFMGVKGFVERADVDKFAERMRADGRKAGVASIIGFDRDGDALVTRAEIEESIAGEQAFRSPAPMAKDQLDRRVSELMKADTNGDGAIDYREMRTFSERAVSASSNVIELVDGYIALGVNGRLTARSLYDQAKDAFDKVDTDKDTFISEEEFKPFQQVSAMSRGASAASQHRCELPKVIPGSKLVLFGTGSGTRQATVSLAGDDGDVTNVADVHVEPGDEPLYIVLTSYSSMLWRFSGAIDRVVRVVATSTRRADNSGAGLGGSGVTGVPKERVAFLASWNCLSGFRRLGDIEEAKTRGSLSQIVGQQPDVKGGSEVTEKVSIPSMKVETGNRAPGWRGLPVVDVTPETVVAAVPVKRFDVMPGETGLAQLVERGNLVRMGSSNAYKIVKTFPRFPTGLTGGIQPNFLLGIGVELPKGSPGWACVTSEETGLSVTPNSPMCNR